MDDDTRAEIAALRSELAKLNAHQFIRVYNSLPRLIAYRFASGLAFGLGTVLGGSILLSFVIMAVSSMDFIPVIGEWAARIADEMGRAR